MVKSMLLTVEEKTSSEALNKTNDSINTNIPRDYKRALFQSFR